MSTSIHEFKIILLFVLAGTIGTFWGCSSYNRHITLSGEFTIWSIKLINKCWLDDPDSSISLRSAIAENPFQSAKRVLFLDELESEWMPRHGDLVILNDNKIPWGDDVEIVPVMIFVIHSPDPGRLYISVLINRSSSTHNNATAVKVKSLAKLSQIKSRDEVKQWYQKIRNEIR